MIAMCTYKLASRKNSRQHSILLQRGEKTLNNKASTTQFCPIFHKLWKWRKRKQPCKQRLVPARALGAPALRAVVRDGHVRVAARVRRAQVREVRGAQAQAGQAYAHHCQVRLNIQLKVDDFEQMGRADASDALARFGGGGGGGGEFGRHDGALGLNL